MGLTRSLVDGDGQQEVLRCHLSAVGSSWSGQEATGAALALVESMPKSIALALEAAVKEYPLLWLQFSNCSGCSVSVINTVHPSIENVLLDQIIPGYQLCSDSSRR